MWIILNIYMFSVIKFMHVKGNKMGHCYFDESKQIKRVEYVSDKIV